MATIVGLTSGTLAIANYLHAWYVKGSSAANDEPQSKTIDKVTITTGDGTRYPLKNLSVQEIAELLETVAVEKNNELR